MPRTIAWVKEERVTCLMQNLESQVDFHTALINRAPVWPSHSEIARPGV